MNRVVVQDYRGLNGLKVKLDPEVTVLHGRNGAGKSNFLNALAFGLSAYTSQFPGVPGMAIHRRDMSSENGGCVVRIHSNSGSWEAWTKEDFTPKFMPVNESGKSAKDIVATPFGSDEAPAELTIPVYYRPFRSIVNLARNKNSEKLSDPRLAALIDHERGFISRNETFEWFSQMDSKELREIRKAGSADAQTKEMRAVRKAVEAIPGSFSNPRMDENDERIIVDQRLPDGRVKLVSIGQVGGGIGVFMHMVLDLVRRMIVGNPHLVDPLKSEAIVLIDEIENHLHLEVQDLVFGVLRKIFPNAQVIATTHSPTILTTLHPHQIC